MAELTLKAQTPLRGYSNRFGDTRLSELSDTAIYSIGLALETAPALKAIKNSLGTDWPEPGKSASSTDGVYRLLGLQADQVFVLFSAATASDGQSQQLPNLGQNTYTTDQSDSWAGLYIEGLSAVAALERICPIDLHSSVFEIGRVTRTSMEHLAVIILHEAENRYLLLSPTSSAQSFLHALETSLQNVIPIPIDN